MALNKNAKKWVKALRSRKYKQTTGRLTQDGKFCCLGVACELAVKAKIIPPAIEGSYAGEHEASLPDTVRDWLGLSTSDGSFTDPRGEEKDLTVLNDIENKKFYQIARVIESEPEGLFTK